MSKDYYEVLGIEKTDDQELIKKAYREKAKAFHPDKSEHPNAQHIFQELNEAYMILSDVEEKQRYDKGAELPKLSHEQVVEILRNRKAYYGERGSIFRYESNNIYPPTDYVANKRNSLVANLVIATIAIIFLIDIGFTGKVNSYDVGPVYYVYSGTNHEDDINKYNIFLGNRDIYVYSFGPPVSEGEEAFISFSPVFGKVKSFITSSGKTYDISGRAYVFWVAVLVCLISIVGTTPLLNAERQFNVAVISGFFSVLLLISLLVT